jgi:hypothetical protein
MKIGPLLAHLDELEAGYADALRASASRFEEEHDLFHQCLTFATVADRAVERLRPLRERYAGKAEWDVTSAPHGTVLLEELRGLYLLAHEVAVTWTMAEQAAKAARDAELKLIAGELHTEADTQAKWFLTRIKVGAPQALVVA